MKLHSSCCHISKRSPYLSSSLFINNNTTHILQHTIIHYPSSPHSIILKLHHFLCPKHISISFFISHTKSSFLESNIINVITQKITPAAALATFNFHIIYLTLPYIFQTHSPQNTHSYLSYIFKFDVSQSIYIYIYIRSMSNKVSTCNSYTYHKHHISQYIYIYIFTISTHLKNISNTLPKTHYKSHFLWKIYIYNAKIPSYERQKLIKSKALLIEGNITHIWLNTKRVLHGESHLSVWWKGINLTNLCTRLDIFSFLLVAPIFPFQTWSHHERIHFIMLLKY